MSRPTAMAVLAAFVMMVISWAIVLVVLACTVWGLVAGTEPWYLPWLGLAITLLMTWYAWDTTSDRYLRWIEDSLDSD